MQEDKLEGVLDQARRTPLPSCPAGLEAKVLRRIREEERQKAVGWFTWGSSVLSGPATLAAAIALFALASATITVASTSAYAERNERQLAASRALDFDFVKQTELVKFDR